MIVFTKSLGIPEESDRVQMVNKSLKYENYTKIKSKSFDGYLVVNSVK